MSQASQANNPAKRTMSNTIPGIVSVSCSHWNDRRASFVNGQDDLLKCEYARLAQLVERQFCKLDVAGSIPAPGSTAFFLRLPLYPDIPIAGEVPRARPHPPAFSERSVAG